MNDDARPLETEFHGDASLGALLAALEPHVGKELVIDYGGRMIRPGYHITEIKAGSFVTLDCGGNPDAWQETILQIEDIAQEGEGGYLSIDKFRGILDQVAQRVELEAGARLTFEVGPPAAAMQIFDVDGLRMETGRVILRLVARSAICKPRHRVRQEAATCRGPKSAGKDCCAA